MRELDYTYSFDYISEQLKSGQVRITNHATNQTYALQVAVRDDQLPLIHYHATPPLLADLIDIATATHMADRLSKNDGNFPRRILLCLPVRQLEILNRPSIHKKLQDVLYWFTEDHWFFSFVPYVNLGRPAQINIPLPFSDDASLPTKTVLWSGGLDSFVGVYQQLLQDDSTHYILFGTGSNDMITSAQKRASVAIERFFPKRTRLVQLPFRLRDTYHHVKKNSSARSRGFVFMLLGAVCAIQARQNALYIYENGIGAINLPFRKSEVGLDHSRSVHPLSLYYMRELLSSILGEPFFLENPFLFWTKAQMCKEPLLGGAARAMFATISCDSRHRKQPIQCGYCSSCLLRRQAIAFHGIEDQTRYQIMEGTGRQRRTEDGIHYYAMLEQVDTMRSILSTDEGWQTFSQHYRNVIDIVDKMDKHRAVMQRDLLRLYQNYIHEWDSVRHIIGPEFLT